MSNYIYIDVSLFFPKTNNIEISPVYFKKNVMERFAKLFGESAYYIDVDLIKFNIETQRGILRVPKSHYIKLRSSLTLSHKYEYEDCYYVIHKVSPLLLSLQSETRNYDF
ncbi:unnamed protein product [Psylliodes chrysocephalus]|uniref:Uncharacterized protein n=1 Tax=Psylliodes chrysocephalus TaxID=3402493 RepID=A0A9P0GIY5_9CUCU|nr:unnamed protein product [Psylliodes chrysocephala]